MRRRGSITIFAALSIMLVAQLLFTLLESARNMEFYRVLQSNTDSVLESMFADYASPLWEDYRILGVTAADSSGRFSLNNREAMLRSISKFNLESPGGFSGLTGSNLLTADVEDVVFDEYLLLTDQQGRVFQAAAASYMKQNLLYEAAKSVYSGFESVQQVREDYGDADVSIGDALSALECMQEDESNTPAPTRKAASAPAPAKEAASVPAERGSSAEPEENLLTTVVETKKTGILSLVLPEGDEVSGAQIRLEKTVSHRTLQQGTSTQSIVDDWYDRVLLNQYLVRYLSNYTDSGNRRGLHYELEYLIGGKGEDAANLKLVVTEILAIREALNLASLAASPQKQSEALALAMLLAGATANPVIVEAVKYGILAAWAYAESVLDVRTLLQGGKIAVLKSETDWTSNLSAVPALLSGWSQAKSSERGISYRDYLSLLLFFHSGERLSMRAMDVQEAAIRQKPGYESFRMDCLVCGTKLHAVYEYVPVFLGFVPLLRSGTDRIRIPRSAQYTYLS